MKPSHHESAFEDDYFTSGPTYGKFSSPEAASFHLSRWYSGLVKLLRTLTVDLSSTTQPVVEIGCGYGGVLELYRALSTPVIGTDISLYALSEIRRRRRNVPIAAVDATKMPFCSGTVGTILAFEVLEHLESPQLTIAEMYRTIKSEGVVIITTPNPIGDIVPGINSNKDATHVSVMPPEQWRRRFVAAGFSSVQVVTTYQIPYMWRYSSRLSISVRIPLLGPACVLVARP